MSVELGTTVEAELRTLAQREGRDPSKIVEEAIRLYIESTSITDLSSEDVGDAQMVLAAEMAGMPPWEDESK